MVFRRIVLLVTAVRLVAEVVGLISIRAHGQPASQWLEMWNRWDAPHYLRIVQVGYRPHTVPGDDPLFIVFFPFFPLAVKLASFVLRDLVLSGLVVSYLSSIGAGWFLYRLSLLDNQHDEAWRAVLLLFAFPTAYFMIAPYTEALFLFAIVASMYAARTNRWPQAGLAGALATGTRVAGLALFPALLVEAWPRLRRFAWIAVAGIGVAVFLTINLVVHHDMFWFLHIERTHWSQHAVAPWQTVIDGIGDLRHGGWDDPTRRLILVSRLVAYAFGVLVLAVGYKVLRLADNVYAWAGFVLIVSTSWLISLPRYLLALYPIFLIGARWTRKLPVLALVLAVFIALQVWFTWWYAAGTWTF
jgi:hypothetical protein